MSGDNESVVFALHRYFIWSNRMRGHLEDTLREQGPIPDTSLAMSDQEREATELAARAWLLPVFLYGSYWLASLHVVVEGWQRLKLTDPTIDPLLDEPFVILLRRYRNAVFHYQPTYLDPRIAEFVAEMRADRSGQASRLHDAFEKYFWQWFEERGGMPIPRPIDA